MIEYNNWFPSYSDLPTEIIFHIFGYLDHGDLQAAGATCTRWNEALHESRFHKNTQIRLSKITLSDRSETAQCLLKSRRPFSCYYLEEVTFGQVTELMKHVGQHIKEITFDNVDVSDKQFYSIMQQLVRLQRLTVTRCSPLFMSTCFSDGQDQTLNVDLNLAHVKKLSLHHNQYLSDAILLRMTALINELELLDLSGCHVAYHTSIHRRFYPNEGEISPSESILTFKFVLKVLDRHIGSLRELNLSHTMISSHSLSALCELQNGTLNLQRLSLAACRQLNSAGMKPFLQTQTNLVALDLSDTSCVNDELLEHIVNVNALLEELHVSGCCGISCAGAAFLSTLKFLKVLDISRCDGISSEGITQGVCRWKNEVLQVLRMSHLKIDEESIKCVAEQLPNLRVLNVNHCGNGITDEAVQSIIQHLRWLRELHMEDCFRITDMALTGIKMTLIEDTAGAGTGEKSFEPLPNSTNLLERQSANSFGGMKISLRTKAEEDIVRDAIRKKAMIAAYEMSMQDEVIIEGYGIQNLAGLKYLNLRGCNKITDVSLKYGFKFNELRYLSLSHCQQVSLLGLEAMVAACPAIETLDLTDCYGINDKSIQIITQKLQRLRHLHLSGCTQLTDHSVDAILTNCKNLQSLSVFRCRRMYTDIEDRLSVLTSLRNLNMDNLGGLDNADIFRLKSRLDY